MRWGDGRVSSMLVIRPDRLKFWFQNPWVILAMLRSQAQENVSINFTQREEDSWAGRTLYPNQGFPDSARDPVSRRADGAGAPHRAAFSMAEEASPALISSWPSCFPPTFIFG